MPGLAAVEVLAVDCGSDMGDTAEQFGSAGARQLAACSALRGLRELRLPMCLVDDAGLVAIAAAEWSALKVLDLRGNDIGSRGVEALTRSPMIQGLEQLDLTGNPIGDEGTALLAQSGVLGRAVVKAGHRGFTDAAAEAILAAGDVRRLVLDFVIFSEEMTARLKATYGDRVAVPE